MMCAKIKTKKIMKQDYEAKLKINNKRILCENFEKDFLASFSLDNENCTISMDYIFSSS